MRRLFLFLMIFSCALPVRAWNGAGHRVAAVIAWQVMHPGSRDEMARLLAAHPDYPRWLEKSGDGTPAAIFAEASTWADLIRHDARYDDRRRDGPTGERPAGTHDLARHADWHYADLDASGRRAGGELDRAIPRLSMRLTETEDMAEAAWALAWLIHLVVDSHQPMHAGHSEDAGGNSVLVEDPLLGKQPFVSLHGWWDDLPGRGTPRGKRLQREAAALMEAYPPPHQGDIKRWLTESRQLLEKAYPSEVGSVSLLITPTFRAHSEAIAQRRIAEAGYRLGGLLDIIAQRRVSRETPRMTR